MPSARVARSADSSRRSPYAAAQLIAEDADAEAGHQAPLAQHQPLTGQPDRFLYSIRAGQRRAVLPERELTGPWRDLVECARAAAEKAASSDSD